MPKSKLRSSISIDEVDSIQATREKVSVESITVNNRIVKRPKFLRAQISPRFQAVGSIETDEVEYDTYVKWAITIPTISKGWAKAYGGSGWDWPYAIAIAGNGDIIVAGYTDSFGVGNGDFWVLRLDADGNVRWQKTYGGSDYDGAHAVAVADNGDIIVAGWTKSFVTGTGGNDYDAWILRLDENGNVKWQKTYGGSDWDLAHAIVIAGNGDIVVVGETFSFGAGNSDFWVLRLDENGNIKWQKTYGGSSGDAAYDVAIAPNGDIIVAGWTESFGAGGHDAWILRLDENGNVKWQKTYGGSGSDAVVTVYTAPRTPAVAIAPNGDIIVAGWTESFGAGGHDAWILRLDENGNVKWQKTYGGSDWDDEAHAIAITPDGDIIVAGLTFNIIAWVLRLDRNGNIKWQKAYYDRGKVYAIAIADNGDIVLGASNQVSILRLDENGNVSASQLTVTDTNCTVTDTNCTVTDTSCTVTDTSCTVTDTDCTVTETDCVVTEL